jgi:hypothetical protein
MARGGFRPGAGRKKGSKASPDGKKKKQGEIPADIQAEAESANLSPLDYMLQVMRDDNADPERRDRMAIAAAPFVHARRGEGKGKKEDREERAKSAGSGKFSPGKAPVRLVKS